jgi:Leucine-rich repeat (LRR) protein
MPNLKILNFNNNRITGLPMELGNLTGLRTLDLSGNNVSQQDLAGIKAKLINTEIK